MGTSLTTPLTTPTTMTALPDTDGGRAIYALLAAPFPPTTLDWRIGQSGLKKDGKPWAKILVYIDARAARARLNDVLGPANWKVSYGDGPANGVVATLSLRLNGEWIDKQDGAGLSDIEATKGGISDAFKRACAVWGIGEYLYDIGESWAVFSENGATSSKIGDAFHKWDPPVLPAKFLPASMKAKPEPKSETDAKPKAETKPAAKAETTPPPPTSRSAPPPTSRSAPSPALLAAFEFEMPFGKSKGLKLREIEPLQIRAALGWARENRKNYAGFSDAASAILVDAFGTAE